MRQEENAEEEKKSLLSPETSKWVRYCFAGLGILASFVGVVLVILTYVLVSPTILTVRDTFMGQVDNGINAISNLDRSLEGAEASLVLVPELSEELSTGFEGYSASTVSLADGIDSLADEMALAYGSSKVTSLKSAASNLRSAADTLGGQSEALSSISSRIEESKTSINDARGDISKAKSDLVKAKRDFSGIFDSLSTALLAGCAMFALVFVALGAYSVALFL